MSLRYQLFGKPQNIDEFVDKTKKIYGVPRLNIEYWHGIIDSNGDRIGNQRNGKYLTVKDVMDLGGRSVAEAKLVARWKKEELSLGLPPAEFVRKRSQYQQLQETEMEFVIARDECWYSMFGRLPDEKTIEQDALNAALYLQGKGIQVTINGTDPQKYHLNAR